jgi:hypothetical protein
MTKTLNKVTVQLYGDGDLEVQMIAALESAGLTSRVTADKPYTTKKGEEGQYKQVVFTLQETNG